MNFLIGLGILVTVVGVVVLFASDFDGNGALVGVVMMCGPIGLFIVAFALFLMLGGSLSQPLVENACYRAVRHTNTTLVPVGKVLIPSTTSGIDLEEIRCP
jgi:hypothetical protein